MGDLNKVFLLGNLTKDPEIRHIATGSAVNNLRLAVNRWYKQKDELKKETCFVNVVTWNRQAEICQEYLKKGSPILVEGRLSTNSWETADGQKRSTIEVIASRISFMGKNQKASQAVFEEEVADKSAESNDAVPAASENDGIPF